MRQEEELVAIPAGYETTIPTARLDSFFAHREDGSFGLNFIEFNGESPAGMAYNDVLSELFLETPLMHEFGKRYHVEPLLARRHAADALLHVYYQWRGGYGKLPDMAIVDWAGVPTTTEFHLFADYFARYGIKSVICTPDDLDFRGGRLYAAGQPVDFVYKRVLTSELLQRYGTQHPMIDALRAGAICMANPFTCKLLHKKASFAIVSDERNAYLFSPSSRRAIQEHIPWTRIVEERHSVGPNGARDRPRALGRRSSRGTGAQAQRRIRRQGRLNRLGNRPGNLGARPAPGPHRAGYRAGARRNRL